MVVRLFFDRGNPSKRKTPICCKQLTTLLHTLIYSIPKKHIYPKYVIHQNMFVMLDLKGSVIWLYESMG